ncbi:peptide-N-glycosidase F-related protein [Hugenholtzia roseola]|uniref:peptide-N-glycosidase F-related protein n=1 Tax=Hugenholtzia roseola TaxID=1002 RepID=UPI0012B60DB6|nr:peptide-N-glycosidase F-related protein [Hugenholtzia roseola]
MKKNLSFWTILWQGIAILALFVFLAACSKEDEKSSAKIDFSAPTLDLGTVFENEISAPKSLNFKALGFSESLVVQSSAGFEISLDGQNYVSQLTFASADLATEKLIWVRFDATNKAVGLVENELLFTGSSLENELKVELKIEIVTDSRPAVLFDKTELKGFRAEAGSHSRLQTFEVSGRNLTQNVTLNSGLDFMLSLDNESFLQRITISAQELNQNPKTVFVRFSPNAQSSGLLSQDIVAHSEGALGARLTAEGEVVATTTYNYKTFEREHLAFGDGLSHRITKRFNLKNDIENVSKINMYVRLDCPSRGCNEWDVYANILVRDPESNQLYEMGRYITPYGVDNRKLERGFLIDVTDFKSILKGEVELQAFIEVWGSDGWLLSVEFDYIEGLPDYAYSAIRPLFQYNEHTQQVPYGSDASAFDLTKRVRIPQNAQKTYFRTLITGWGHATPMDNGRPCAEWCFRTHQVKIDGAPLFSHQLNAIGCANNPVRPQNGNWRPDRAGWCPGMEVPIRLDEFAQSRAGQEFSYEYSFQNWRNDGNNGGAFYAISAFVVVKSDTPIEPPTVME